MFCFVLLLREVVNVLLFDDSAAIRWTYLSLFTVNVISCFSYYMTLLLISLVSSMLFFGYTMSPEIQQGENN